ncbi:hypothetical protein EJB05_22468 [Eragrostis curvula]|uniref:RNase H type-1 domain-containing protein n=1 Tax=Eragrostis curvula TaxID=38414 RepID=A0A5J9V5N7_9POAL|nr:hypothetical protein EJB05_22468 [Eragrostis curvula]
MTQRRSNKRGPVRALEKSRALQDQKHLDALISRLFSGGTPFNFARNPYLREAFSFAANKIFQRGAAERRKESHKLFSSAKSTWDQKGVTICADGWTDPQKRRSDTYKKGETRIWDVGGDSFESLSGVGILDISDLSPDKPQLEAISFGDAEMACSVEVNIDGSFCCKDKAGAWGFVVRDNAGLAVLVGAGRIVSAHDAVRAEMSACLMALKACSEQGMVSIQIKTDCFNPMKTSTYDCSPGGVLFREARSLVSLFFNNVEFIHLPRTGNRCAHELALYGLSRDPKQPELWLDPLPEFVTELMTRDLVGSVGDLEHNTKILLHTLTNTDL